MKDILAIASAIRKKRVDILGQNEPALLTKIPRITEFASVKGKKKVAAENAVNSAVSDILGEIRRHLIGPEGTTVHFPISFSITTNREALNLSPASWEPMGLSVELSPCGIQSKAKTAKWYLRAKISLVDITKPVAKSCVDIIAMREEKARYIEQSEERFLAAADRVYQTILDNVADLALGQIDQIVLPLYLTKKNNGWVSNQNACYIKRIPKLFNPPTSDYHHPTALKLDIGYSALHVLNLEGQK